MKNLNLPSDAVLVLIARARETGPQIDINISTELATLEHLEYTQTLDDRLFTDRLQDTLDARANRGTS